MIKRVLAIALGAVLLLAAAVLVLLPATYQDNGGATVTCSSSLRDVVQGERILGGELSDAQRAAMGPEETRRCRPSAWAHVGGGAAAGLVGVGLVAFGAWPRRRRH